MSDIFREVDEEVRQDRVQLFLGRYWGWLLVAMLAIVAAVGGWRGYEYWRLQQAQDAGGRYLDALQLARDGKSAEATSALSDLGAGKGGYALLARFRLAAQTGQTDPAAGAKAYDALAADGTIDPAFQDSARLRAAILLIDTADVAEMRRRLESLADANSAMRNPAREILALAALRVSDFASAGTWLDAIMDDPTATGSARQRATALLGLVRTGKAGKP